jgi:hypothetical protein
MSTSCLSYEDIMQVSQTALSAPLQVGRRRSEFEKSTSAFIPTNVLFEHELKCFLKIPDLNFKGSRGQTSILGTSRTPVKNVL